MRVAFAAHTLVARTRATVVALLFLAGCWKAAVINVGSAIGGAPDGSAGDTVPSPVETGGTIQLTLDPDAMVVRPIADAEVTTQVVGCDGGDACVCPTLSVAVVGNRGMWGDNSDTAFRDWLNSNSASTAKVNTYQVKPTFTADFLSKYTLVILAGLADDSNNGPWWTFSAAEIAAFRDWIENKGGGVISLSGYSDNDTEISAKNALLAFSGIAYQDQIISPACALLDANKNKMCYRCGNPYQITEWASGDPVTANLSRGVSMIGVEGARPISAPADAHVAAKTTTSSGVNNWLVAKVTGKGRVLVYGDEWITYTNQWSGQNKQYANDPSCTGYLPQDRYQTAQLWYNMIHWTQPSANCFTIVNTPAPILIW